MTKGLMTLAQLLSAAFLSCCSDAPKQETFETNPFTLSKAPSPFELETFYKREAIAIVNCIVRHGASCEHPAIAETEVHSNQADVLSPLGTLDAALKKRMHDEFSRFDQFVVSWATARVPPPYQNRIPATPPIPPDLVEETWVEVGIDLINDPTGPRMRLQFQFRDGKLVALNKLETQLIGGKLK